MSEATIHTQDVEGAAGVPSTSWLSTHHSSLVTHHSFSACHAITTAANSSFPVAFRLLSPARRRAMDALYAYMRVTDDIADEPAPPDETRRALAAWRAGLTAALAGAFTHPIHPAHGLDGGCDAPDVRQLPNIAHAQSGRGTRLGLCRRP